MIIFFCTWTACFFSFLFRRAHCGVCWVDCLSVKFLDTPPQIFVGTQKFQNESMFQQILSNFNFWESSLPLTKKIHQNSKILKREHVLAHSEQLWFGTSSPPPPKWTNTRFGLTYVWTGKKIFPSILFSQKPPDLVWHMFVPKKFVFLPKIPEWEYVSARSEHVSACSEHVSACSEQLIFRLTPDLAWHMFGPKKIIFPWIFFLRNH